MNRTRNRRILVQRPMRSDGVVVIGIGLQNPTQMCLAQNNNVVQALAADRSDQPFGKAILPRRGWCNWLVPNAHGAQSTCDDGAINAIPVSDHVARSPVPRKRLRSLTGNPFCRRIPCDVDPDYGQNSLILLLRQYDIDSFLGGD